MDQNNTPDSWEQSDGGGAGDQQNISEIAKGLGSLNVNATPFVPGQNVFARAFVPNVGDEAECDVAVGKLAQTILIICNSLEAGRSGTFAIQLYV